MFEQSLTIIWSRRSAKPAPEQFSQISPVSHDSTGWPSELETGMWSLHDSLSLVEGEETKRERRTEAGDVIIPPPGESLCQPEFW